MVKIIRQPMLGFLKFRQVYQFDLPAGCPHPIPLMADFYRGLKVRNLTVEPEGIHFSRGNRWKSLVSPSELNLKQHAVIRILSNNGGRTIVCEYQCYPSLLCTLRLGPSQLFKEVRLLQRFLQNSPVMSGQTASPEQAPAWLVRPIFKLLYKLYRFFSWLYYHGGRRFTPAGLLTLCGLVAAAAMGMDTDSTVTVQAFTPLFFLLFIAFVFSWFFRAKFSASRRLPRVVTVGRAFSYPVQVKNLSATTQTGLTLLEDLADPRPSYEEWLAAQLADERRVRAFKFNQRTNRAFLQARVKEAQLPPLRPGEEAEARVEVVPLRRGVIRFTGVSIARPDPMGLFRSFNRAPADQSVLVLPTRYPLPRVALPGTEKYQPGGVVMAASVGRSDEFVSLRDYRRGDPVRHIHWRSWAKTGKPIVKEFEDDYFTRHALVLDTFTDDPRGVVFEEAVSVAASFACTIPMQESLLDLLFVGPKAYCFTSGRGLAHTDQMLEILASVRAISNRPFRSLEPLVLEHAAVVSGCIFVLLDWDDARQELVRKVRLLGVPLRVIVVVEAESSTTVAPGVMRDDPVNFHVLEAGRIEAGLAKLT